jgi:phosphoglycerate dehydrogenase-like enzyme
MKIYVAIAGLDSTLRARLAMALAGHEIVIGDTLASDELRRQAVAGAQVVFANVPPAWLRAAPRLRWVQLDSAGVDAYLGLNAGRAGAPVTLTNLRDFYGRAVAEAALAGILAHLRQLPRLLAAQRESRWIKTEVEPDIGRLHEASVIILGAGAIGRCLQTLLGAFECEVRFFARRAPKAALHTLAELDAALPEADLVINTLPHTPETTGLLDAARLARLKPSALLVNVGRGSALDENALLEALDAGRLAGAVLDVTAIEPLPVGSGLWRHPRVLLTQHTGGRFPGETAAKVGRFLENFARFARGEPLPTAVDLVRGY